MISTTILPMMDRIVADPIPNIRFNVAKSYAVVIDTLNRLPETGTVADAAQAGKEQSTPRESRIAWPAQSR